MRCDTLFRNSDGKGKGLGGGWERGLSESNNRAMHAPQRQTGRRWETDRTVSARTKTCCLHPAIRASATAIESPSNESGNWSATLLCPCLRMYSTQRSISYTSAIFGEEEKERGREQHPNKKKGQIRVSSSVNKHVTAKARLQALVKRLLNGGIQQAVRA